MADIDPESFTKDVLAEAIKTTKLSSALPLDESEYDYYINFPGYKTFCCRIGSRINKLINKVIQYEQVPVSWPPVNRDELASPEIIEEQFDNLVEANDILLERISNYLDQATKGGSDAPPIGANVGVANEAGSTGEDVSVALWNKKKNKSTQVIVPQWRSDIPRPQSRFKDMVDNSLSPFIPHIRHKPNAIKPLPAVYTELQKPSTLQALIENARKWAESSERLQHPYQYEIEACEPLNVQLELMEPQMYKSLDDTPLLMVSTLEQLNALLSDLKTAKEVAIDLEAHSYRSFQGFVCLMQLSTRTTDYIVDTLELREHLNCLNEVFTDPTIIKVMHGADWDIPWLQRDFGLYVVNLFDTGQASRVLGLPKLSLAFLLNYCCNVTANKGYQLADWRIRPLPEKMIKYAREDTHYLLYIYDRMRNELIRRGNSLSNLITVVLKNSKEICLKQYEKQVYDEKGYKKLCRKFRRSLKPQQVYCLQLLHKWRFDLARQEDESTGYVLPDHMMFQLAEILPREIEGIIACCTPVPTLLRQQIQEVNRLIQIARNTTDMYIIENVPVIVESSAGGGGDTAVDGHGSDDDDDDGGIDQVIVISGPPVLAKDPVISIMAKPLSTMPSEVEKVFSKIQEGFKQMLSIYTQPSMAPPDYLINHYMAAQMSSAKEDTPIKATTPKLGQKRKSSSNNEESSKKVSKVETPIGGERTDKGKQAKINERPQKHPQDIPDFQPFDFALNTFSSLTKVQDNTSKSKSSKKTFKKPPKSKSKRSSSNKSGTFKKTN